jgi:uncharacterized repeat protein (TIGR03803 family)
MRNLVSIGLAIALVSWSAAMVGASPPPFLLTQRAVPSALSLPLSGTPYGRLRHAAGAPQSVHPSTLGADGLAPLAGLIDVNGILYGTTQGGGQYGGGTVFAITRTGQERVLHSFGSGTDGAYPWAGLVAVNGVLYGTTYGGGQYGDPLAGGYGTVFAVTTTGQERVLHSFEGVADGINPVAGLLDVNGVLYGTTEGLESNYGTVFAITPTGRYCVLHTFTGGADGAAPEAGLVAVNGVLYGTTVDGPGQYDAGTVFAVTRTGQERVVYTFTGGADGADPAGLVAVNGVLYGTTYGGGLGGAPGGPRYFGGTVFAVTTTGHERVLHSFGSGMDGANPSAGLVDVNGVFYGTTQHGGRYGGGQYGGGTVFAVTTTGQERVLHSFEGGADGAQPLADLIEVGCVLYGTTYVGGKGDLGTVFAVTRTGQERVLHSFGGVPGSR